MKNSTLMVIVSMVNMAIAILLLMSNSAIYFVVPACISFLVFLVAVICSSIEKLPLTEGKTKIKRYKKDSAAPNEPPPKPAVRTFINHKKT